MPPPSKQEGQQRAANRDGKGSGRFVRPEPSRWLRGAQS
jgi:hypothetical protein